ncbi:hypothetical protein [Flavobacterium sp. UBA7680]|uniref:hypothetical protein n=1 Tax=Flavobacterium sp. UBA7680 TaxID=1946559 RepID=UPI0025C365F0|nr:hypothetical protein [Flavobacterium sp. UBA7680]
MEDDLNLEVRSQVLYYSLNTESYINTLLLSYLGITDDKNSTKNFGNKAGISFKNKLDLLYDINVFTKDEYLSIDLLMIFRNRFLHDIDSNTYTNILENLENGLKNRFKVFIETDGQENEKKYEKAFEKLYFHNLKIINNKYAERTQSLERHQDFLIGILDAYESLSSLSNDFASDICLRMANILDKNPEAIVFIDDVSEKIVNYTNELKNLGTIHEKLFESHHYNIILAGKTIL